MEKVIISIFTDPMMGLSYECQPIFDRLTEKYGDQLKIRHVMAGLVRDVSAFMTQDELALGPEEGIRKYCGRLAQIYKSEEPIGGLPINMEGFHLFDKDHRSSYPLDIAYKAAQLADPTKADKYLKNLRIATIVETRQTTLDEELIRIAEDTGIDPEAFSKHYFGGTAKAAFEEDLSFARSLGIWSLPAYLIQYGEEAMLINRLVGYDVFVNAIAEITGGKIN